ncbi:hypothetical protein V493_02449 [Pseudogymnoascus sp. VKM F-4281 (FW-2241)]|nr:hypothetical protein V493_02449 [Pseudogymnoascus sp. VKM F-4281 (FW-2241)]
MAQQADSESETTEIPRKTKPYSVVRRQLVILGCFPLSEGVAWSTIFPYIYSMVKSLSAQESSKDDIAIYAGLMVSVFTFGEFIGAPQWAKISDRIGRKPTILIGSIGAVFSALLFGFSTSIPMAIAARMCAGLLNPNLGVVTTFVGELVVSKDQEADGFSVVPTLRSLGTIIGPVIGGYLAEPVKNYPSLFHEGTVWDKFPYLLPNLAVVVFLLSSCTLGLFCLEEVHLKFRDQVNIKWTLTRRIQNIFKGKRWNADEATYTPLREDEADSGIPLRPISTAETPEEPEVKPPSAFTRQVKLQILSNAIQGFLKISTLAIVPVFLATPPEPGQPQNSTRGLEVIKGIFRIEGGFGLDTMDTSNVLLSQAIATIGGQTLLVPAIIRRKGPLRSYRLVVVILICLYCLLPFTANWSTEAGIPTMLIILWIYTVASSLATTCSQILIRNTVPSPIYLATVNGAAASLGCLARTLGPAVSGPLFRLGLQTGYVGLPFWLLGVVTGLGGIVSLYLVNHA